MQRRDGDSELKDVAGVQIVDRAPVRDEVVFTMVKDFGGLKEGEELSFRGFSSESNMRGALIEAAGAEVLAVDERGNPVLTRAAIGEGQTILCAFPVELGLADTADAFLDDRGAWRLYAALAVAAGARPPAAVEHPELATHLLTGPRGAVLIVLNHSADPVGSPVRLPDGVVDVRRITPEGATGWEHGAELVLQAHDVAVLTWANS